MSALGMSMEKLTILHATPYPDDASSPSRLTKAQSAKKENWVKNSCKASGNLMDKKLAALGIQPHVGSAHRERQVLPPQHDQRTDDTDGLGQHGSQCRTRRVQAEPGHEYKITHDVDDAGDENENQRRTAVAQAAERSGQ